LARGKSVASLRNLPQYKDKTDKEILEAVGSRSFQEKVQARIDRLAEDYDLSDMKYNDHTLVQRWGVLTERLETEEEALRLERDSLSAHDALREEQRLSGLQRDILSIQEALNITRAKRRDTSEDNPRLLYEDIKMRAAKFLEERLAYIKCPKCGMVLCTVNFLYPDAENVLKLGCGDCGASTEVTSREAVDIERNNPYH
jgi:hypothetical protein